MTYRVKLEDHARFAEKLNELIEQIVHLDVDISNTIGVTKAGKILKLKKVRDLISETRWNLENLMLNDFPDAPLYTQYRSYRGEDPPEPKSR